MKRLLMTGLAVALSASAQTLVSVRILFGVRDTVSTRWDGSVQVQGGSVASIEPWRSEGSDSISGSAWQISTRPVRGRVAANLPVVANGIVVHLSSVAPTKLRV